jgi:hypothetical protein
MTGKLIVSSYPKNEKEGSVKRRKEPSSSFRFRMIQDLEMENIGKNNL